MKMKNYWSAVATLWPLNELKLDCFGAELLAKTGGGRSPRSSSRAPKGGMAIQELTHSWSFLLYFFIALSIFIKGANALEATQSYEKYLNELTTLSGNFTQINNNGRTVTGKIDISRPGKMRLTYDPPSSLLIVADGKWLITADTAADQVDYVSLEKTPAAFILSPNINFDRDVVVTNVVRKDEGTEVSLVRREEPEAGQITLVFQEDPIALKEWSILDPQGAETRVILSEIQQNIPLDPRLFAIKSPNLFQRIF
jgi:outer membrane lipoprotein-sorting protein